MRRRLEDLYAQQSATSKVYWLKKLMDRRMKKDTTMSVHLNEFNSIIKQLVNHKFNINDEFKATFVLCAISKSPDIFKTALSNSNPILVYANGESQLLMEEMNRKNNASSKSSTALSTRGRPQHRGNDNQRNKSRSKSRPKKDIERFHCSKKEHMKKDCFKLKKE